MKLVIFVLLLLEPTMYGCKATASSETKEFTDTPGHSPSYSLRGICQIYPAGTKISPTHISAKIGNSLGILLTKGGKWSAGFNPSGHATVYGIDPSGNGRYIAASTVYTILSCDVTFDSQAFVIFQVKSEDEKSGTRIDFVFSNAGNAYLSSGVDILSAFVNILPNPLPGRQ